MVFYALFFTPIQFTDCIILIIFHTEYNFFFCTINPIVVYHIKIDTRAAINHNKFYW